MPRRHGAKAQNKRRHQPRGKDNERERYTCECRGLLDAGHDCGRGREMWRERRRTSRD
jgi:hypothetical protein